MAYTKEDLLARLRKGEDPDTIADEMVKALNDAMDAKKAEDEAAAEQAKIDANRMADAEDIATLINDFAKTYYDTDIKYTGQMVCDVMDATKQFSNIKVKFSKSHDMDVDTIINEFLDSFGLK